MVPANNAECQKAETLKRRMHKKNFILHSAFWCFCIFFCVIVTTHKSSSEKTNIAFEIQLRTDKHKIFA